MNGPNYDVRRNRLRRKLKELKNPAVDSILITGPANGRYLTGFTGDSSWLFLTASNAVMLSDTRYETQLAEECPGLDVEIRDAGSTINDMAARVIAGTKVRHVGFESDYVTMSLHASLKEKVTSAELVSTSGLVERLREVKDKWEIEQIREAVRIAERGIAVVRSSLRSEQSETEIRYLLESAMRDFGASGTAFEPIVGVGPTSALPHAHAGKRVVSESAILLIDWGAQTHSHYRSDLTRVFITSKPTKQMEQVYRVVLAAQQTAINAIRPGVRCADVDRIARGMIEDAGFGKYFGHGLGHGFGLEIHESVRMSPLSGQEFEPGMVVTVEPGIYLPGKFGVRIEDDLLVTSDGNEVLTNVPREFEEAIVPFLA
jgi:Xaa-Pro aminopeptidase